MFLYPRMAFGLFVSEPIALMKTLASLCVLAVLEDAAFSGSIWHLVSAAAGSSAFLVLLRPLPFLGLSVEARLLWASYKQRYKFAFVRLAYFW
ncbi:hypothetical protein SK128_008559 [Halocaridina rubra]|uniref:Uncharacterized protein n=1 Tax=Halocaridina rubra TaxID=373956 RepID=A0AAN8XI88_HALRR